LTLEHQPAIDDAAEDAIEKGRQVLERIELANIRLVDIDVDLDSPTPMRIAPLDFGCEDMQFRAARGRLANRFRYSAKLHDVLGDRTVGGIKFAIVVDFTVDEDYEPDRAGADFLCTTTFCRAALPYAQELLLSTVARLDMADLDQQLHLPNKQAILTRIDGEDAKRTAGLILDRIRPSKIRVTDLRARLVGSEPGRIGATEVRVKSEYATGVGGMANRFGYSIGLLGHDDSRVADVEFTLIVDYSADLDFEPTEDGAMLITEAIGHFAAFPYARELVQSMTSRLQLDPVVLGLLHRGSTKPKAVSTVVIGDDSDEDST
jgi:hypothetical protein